MKKLLIHSLFSLAVFFLLQGSSFALSLSDLGTQITVNDGHTPNSSGSQDIGSAGEDHETELGTIANQCWDSEGIFWNSSTSKLYIISGPNDTDRQSGINTEVAVDLFIGNIDVLYLERQGVINPQQTITGGYLKNLGDYYTRQFSSNDAVLSGLFSSWGTNQDNHYIFEINASSLVASLINSGSMINMAFSCVNNTIEGKGVPVPEPRTMLLFGSGLIWLGAFGRKRFLKR
jgi:hypothetical protein